MMLQSFWTGSCKLIFAAFYGRADLICLFSGVSDRFEGRGVLSDHFLRRQEVAHRMS